MLKLASEFFICVGLRGPCSLFHDLIAVYISVDHERCIKLQIYIPLNRKWSALF